MNGDLHERVTRNEVEIDELEDRIAALERKRKASPWFRHPAIPKILQHGLWIVGLTLSYIFTKGTGK